MLTRCGVMSQSPGTSLMGPVNWWSAYYIALSHGPQLEPPSAQLFVTIPHDGVVSPWECRQPSSGDCPSYSSSSSAIFRCRSSPLQTPCTLPPRSTEVRILITKCGLKSSKTSLGLGKKVTTVRAGMTSKLWLSVSSNPGTWQGELTHGG